MPGLKEKMLGLVSPMFVYFDRVRKKPFLCNSYPYVAAFIEVGTSRYDRYKLKGTLKSICSSIRDYHVPTFPKLYLMISRALEATQNYSFVQLMNSLLWMYVFFYNLPWGRPFGRYANGQLEWIVDRSKFRFELLFSHQCHFETKWYGAFSCLNPPLEVMDPKCSYDVVSVFKMTFNWNLETLLWTVASTKFE